MNQDNQNTEKLRYFLVKKGKRNNYFVAINNKLKVVHRYNKSVFDRAGENFLPDFLSFIDSIGISIGGFWSMVETSDSLMDAKMSVYIHNKLIDVGKNNKFSELFSEPVNE